MLTQANIGKKLLMYEEMEIYNLHVFVMTAPIWLVLAISFFRTSFAWRFYAPNFGKVEGAYCFRLVRPCVRPLQNLLRYSFEISYMDSSSKNK